MDPLSVFVSTFAIVFVGELGDKTQIAAGTGTLANKKRTWVIFFSSSLALIAVAVLTVALTGLLPDSWLPQIKIFGGALLLLYGLYLFLTAKNAPEDDSTESS